MANRKNNVEAVEAVETTEAVEAVETTEAKVKQYKVKSPVANYCGIGASGVQFAYGEAVVNEGWVLEWYREHGFEIEEI